MVPLGFTPDEQLDSSKELKYLSRGSKLKYALIGQNKAREGV